MAIVFGACSRNIIKDEKNMNNHIVVCLGASIVRGQISYNFVKLLEQRMAEDGFQFINAGVAGYQAYNILMHLDSTINKQPDFVIILVGTNDVTATLSPMLARLSRLGRKFPQRPSAKFYQDNMLTIVKILKDKTSAKIALISLPILGEDLSSTSNHRIKEYNALLKEIAAEEHVGYLPVYERQVEYLKNLQQGKGRPYNGGLLSIKALIRHYLLRQSFDEISRKNRFLLLTDGIHLNSRSAIFIADEIDSFLRSHV